MGLFTKGRTDETGHRGAFKRKLKRVSHRDLEDLLEGHVGQLSVAVLAMRQGGTEGYTHALWEAIRLNDEVAGILEELDAIA